MTKGIQKKSSKAGSADTFRWCGPADCGNVCAICVQSDCATARPHRHAHTAYSRAIADGRPAEREIFKSA